MNPTHSPLTTTLSVLLPVLLGLTLGLASRKALPGEAMRGRVASVLDGLALKLLLPFFIIESIQGAQLTSALLLAVLLGFAMPLLTLAGLQAYAMWRRGAPDFPRRFDDLRFTAATFGGGNRGTALLVLLFGAHEVAYREHLKWFALVDLGNFLCLLTVVSLLMRRHYGGGAPAPAGAGAMGRVRQLLDNYVVVTLAVVLAYLLARMHFPAVDEWLRQTVQVRKLLFSVLLFWAITLKFRMALAQGLLADTLALIAGRLLAAAVLGGLLYLWHAPAALATALAVLILMPPSSLVPALVRQAGARESSVSYVSTFAGAANLSYVILVALGVVLLLGQSG